MMRLIDATYQDKLLKHWRDNKENGVVFIPDFVIEKILAQPTVEAQPVIHAHWEWKKTPLGKDVPFCTHCNKTGFYTTNYCSCCGAIMDEVIE